LAKAPDDRFQTAAIFEGALEECVVDVLAAESASGRPLPRMRSRRNLIWALSAFSLAFASYAGLRVLAKVAEPPLHAAELAPSPPEGEAAAALGARISNDQPNSVAPAQNDVPSPASPEPAVVAIRSNPPGAMVLRNGQKLGETPISLLVRPSEPFVRVELRLAGYQPLAAELTAKDGERTLKLTKEAMMKPVPRKTRVAQRAASTDEPAKAAPAAPAPKHERDPYERFE
jgi:hypothetical protein